MDRFDFTDRKIIVTGASSGVGRETAILLSQMGAKVVLFARREEELLKTLSRMDGEGHGYRVVDMSDFDAVIQTVKSVVEEEGQKINGIAHCAGVAIPTPLRATTKDAINTMMTTNFYSFAALLRCAGMKKLFQDGGSVVGVASCVAPYGQAGNGIYGASKGAMNALMKSAAKELRPRGIRVNTICPCGIKTEMLVNQALKTIEGDSLDTLPDYLMLPEKVASVIVALMSDSMQYVSGIALDVDEAKTWEE